MSGTHNHAPLDKEWVELLKMARDAGLTKEEVLHFLQKNDTARKTQAAR